MLKQLDGRQMQSSALDEHSAFKGFTYFVPSFIYIASNNLFTQIIQTKYESTF